MRVFLHDAGMRNNLLPLTYFKSIGELRIGILTQQESWAKAIGDSVELYSENTIIAEGEEILVIYAGLIATPRVVEQVATLERDKRLSCNVTLAARFYNDGRTSLHWDNLTALKNQELVIGDDVRIVTRPWHIFQQAQAAIEVDFEHITAGRTSAPLDPSVRIYGNHRIFLESGAQAIDCTLNTHGGIIYVGRGAEIMEGAAIRGTFALGEHSVVKMGAKIYGATTVGPECKVGGELSNVSIQSYSNKAHDGFIGNTVIGSWCNLGADTNCSNLKNTYEQVKIWSEVEGHYTSTGLQFCGLFMGDHSKTGINTMLNTGTSIGAFCNIFGSGFPRTWIPPFSWGGAAGFETQNIEQALRTARMVMARRGCELSKEAEDAAYKLYFEVLQNKKKQ